MPDPQDSYPRSLLPPGALASSREDVDPAQIGALVAQLVQGGGAKKPFTPPRQSSQPVLSPAAASIVPPRAAAVSHAQVPVAHIGAPVVGERFVPPTFPQLMTSDNPLAGLIETSGLVGPARPRAVQAEDPYGDVAWMKGAGPPPLMLGTTEQVGESALGRGLYSRVDDVAAALPERGLHPNKVASLLKSGAAQEEVAYRKLPEFLASKGNNPVTRAEMQAHLSANPAPMPETSVLGVPRQPGNYTVFHEGTDSLGRALRVEIRRPDGFMSWSNASGGPVAPDQLDALMQTYHNQPMPEKVNRQTKYGTYTLPEGENYREHLVQLPNAPSPELQVLTDRRDAIRDSIAAIDVPVHEQTLPTDPVQVRQWFDEQVAHRRALMEEHSALNDQIDAHKQRVPPRVDYQEGHYGGEYPNVLAHVRTKERSLPVAGLRSVEELEPIIQQAVNAKTPSSIASGAPGAAVRQGLITPEEAQLYSAHRRFYNGPGNVVSEAPANRGRFIEEIQSDWHQTGKRVGYQGVATPEQQARIAQLVDEIPQARERMVDLHRQHTDARNTYLAQLEQATRTHLPPEYQHLRSFSDALNEAGAAHTGDKTGAVPAWRTARERAFAQGLDLAPYKLAEEQLDRDVTAASAHHQTLVDEHRKLTNPSGVPDSPYKEAWPDLALKQQLLDVARDPHANWLGFTGGKTQAERYDLSKQVSQLTYTPAERGDYSQGTLVALDHQGDEVLRKRDIAPHELDDIIGKEPAEALRNKFIEHERTRAYERDQWSIVPDGRGRGFNVHDPNGELLHNYGGNPEWFPREDVAQEHIDSLIEQSSYESPPLISGLDLQVGGKGMTHFYDNLLPSRLRKLVKPFGGTVEPFQLPAGTTTEMQQIPAFSVRGESGYEYGRWATRAEAEHYLRHSQVGRLGQGSIHPATILRPADVPQLHDSWITRLTPEMKREILRRGFPLLTLPLAAGAASLASRPGADVGTPPPVEPPMAVSHPQPQPHPQPQQRR